jgi:hypothetical protein
VRCHRRYGRGRAAARGMKRSYLGAI